MNMIFITNFTVSSCILNSMNLIHPEYPTRQRFIREKTSDEDVFIFDIHCLDPENKKEGSVKKRTL